jgi:hypothetical protein
MAEPLARRGDADEVNKIDMLAHARQDLERKVQQGGHGRRVQFWQ